MEYRFWRMPVETPWLFWTGDKANALLCGRKKVMYPVIECNPVRPAQKLPSWRPFLCSLIPAIPLQNRSLIIINVSVSVHIVQMALAFDGFIGQLKKLRLFTLTFTADLAEVITQSL